MLRELRVENYAVIDNVAVAFEGGLNLLTGETGAGKSILIDALSLLLGEKSSSEMVRHGCEKAVVSADFDLTDAAAALLEELGVDTEGTSLILRREITVNGKGRVFINNQPAAVAVLKKLAPHLAAIHAQNESLQAFDPASRLAMLDEAGGIDRSLLAAFHEKWRQIVEHIADLERGEQDKLRLADLWSYQLKEIESAAPLAGEEEKLESEKRVLANSERVLGAALGAYDSLYDGANSAATSIRNAVRQLEELSRFDTRFVEHTQTLQNARISVEDVGTTLRDYAEGIEASPERLAEIEDRLATLERLRRKYGHTIEDVLAFCDDLRGKLSEIENKDELLAELKKQQEAAAKSYLAEARRLSQLRCELARKLERAVEKQINDLAMKAKFVIEVTGSDESSHWTPAGFDNVDYLIATNPGEPLLPMEKIASGGEISRLMLALKVSLEAQRTGERRETVRTLVFDEIDAGIGGRAAEAVGQKLKALARRNQVLCITHLPQIAAFADQHYLIEKTVHGGRTTTGVRALEAAERRQEVARMLSGAAVTDASLKNADQLIRESL